LAVKRGVKEPDYRIIEQKKDYEIREYGSYVVAEVEIKGGYEDALNRGFNVLASYIFGNNLKKEEMEMTTPVTSEPKPQKIGMTAPVTQEFSGENSVISFVMPTKYTLETLPVPNDRNISFRLIEPKKVAVKRKSGYASKEKMLRAQRELEDLLKKDGVKIVSDFRYAQYDPPFTPPFMRRNEVMVDIL
jgi:hypothetical protein